ncbi:BGTF surface domain-containing protein [Halobellus sp. GM3]|uniref:BGTF surface domain-containing protein n=1 Tax=Halobellus sp. GM3 TaxID=3458410 RepID=UPI00403E29DF
MTENTNQFRAAFLAVILILSVFAGTVVFSGSVAAAESADGGNVSNATVYEQTTNTHTVQLNSTLNTTDGVTTTQYANYTVSFPDSPDFDLSSEDNSTVQVSGGGSGTVALDSTYWDSDNNNFTIRVERTGSTSGEQDLNLTFQLRDIVAPEVSSTTSGQASFALDTNDDGTSEYSTDIQQLTVESTPEGAPELQSAVHYDDSGDEGIGVELAFSEAVNVSASDIALYEDGSAVTHTVQDTGVTERVFVTTNSEILTGDLEVNLGDSIEDVDGDALTDAGNNSVTFAPVTVKTNDDESAYKGGNVAIVSESGNDVGVEIEGPESFYFDGSTDTNSEVFVLNTTNRDLGQYNVSIDGSDIDNTHLTLRDLELGVTVDDYNVTTADAIEGTVEARGSERAITLELLDSGGDTVDGSSTSASLNGQGEYDFSFDASSSGLDLEEGNYTVLVTDDYSGVEVESEDVSVTAAGDEDATFTESVVTDERGDVVELAVELQRTSTATLTLGTEDQGVVSNVTVEDDDGDDRVTLYLNTTALEDATGTYSDGGNVYSLDSDSDDGIVTADIGTNVDDLIDAGEYDLAVRPGENAGEDSTDVATLVLEARGTTEINTWTAQDGFDPTDLEDVNEALDDGELTAADEVANGDVAVHELVTTGFEGTFDAQHSEEITSAFLDKSAAGTVYNFSIEQADPGANQEAWALNLSAENTTVIADGDNDTYYVFVDTGEVNTYDGSSIPNDESLTANFTVFNDDATDFTSAELDDDEDETTLVDYDVVEPEHTVSEPYNVSNAAEQTVSGETTLAPGTELRLRVRSTEGTSPSFLKTASPVVQSDRTWSAEFDFSEQSVGDTYDIVVSGGAAADVTESGQVVEVVETPTPEPDTDTPEPDTDSPEPDTDTPEPDTATESEPGTDTDGADTETPTSTPGFGVVVALTALLAAALLAVRTQR